MTLRIEFDITRPLCVLLISCSLFHGQADRVIVLMHENLLLLPAFGTVTPHPLPTLCQ